MSTTKKGAKADETRPILKKDTMFPSMWGLKPPEGYKFKLWSYGQYGLHVFLVKLEKEEVTHGH